jgi:hypothetical protein
MKGHEVNTIEEARAAVLLNPKEFSRDFYDWISSNWHIYEHFVISAQRVVNSGYKHYSARTIIEVLRHRSHLREIGNGDWKINDHCIPNLSRLYMLLNPQHSNLFETRERKAV